MASHRPQRALRTRRAVRVARITVPALVVGALASGIAVAALPGASLNAAPAPAPSVSAEALRAVSERPSRDEARPAPAPSVAVKSPSKASKGPAKKATPKRAPAKPAQPKASRTEKLEVAKVKPKPEPKLDLTVIGSRYLTADLNVRTEPNRDAKVVVVLETRSKVRVTDTIRNGFRLIVRDGNGRWVSNDYLARNLPPVEKSAPEAKQSSPARKTSPARQSAPAKQSSSSDSGISNSSCNKSQSIESGLVSNGVKVYRALCARFPNISSFGGRRPANGGFHPTGQAVDAMISNGGWEVAQWLRANAGRLGVSEVIHAQKIWTVQRGGEGWRGMSDQGNATANHFDHVHVSVY